MQRNMKIIFSDNKYTLKNNRNYAVKVIAGMLCMAMLMTGFILPDAIADNRFYIEASGKTGGNTGSIDALVPLGHTVGVKLLSEGVIIVGLSTVAAESGSVTPAATAGLLEGDIIQYINDERVTSSEHVTEIVNKINEEPITIRAARNGRVQQFSVTPAKSRADGIYKLGVWIRDSMAGIGTLTFFDPKSRTFGALGHGVNDLDTAQLIPIKKGTIMPSTIIGVRKGESGKPGELKGEFDPDKDIGQLFANTRTGIYGKINEDNPISDKNSIPVASNDEIKVGEATILSNIDGDEIGEYSIEILKIFPNSGSVTKNMMIVVTDDRLLETTGGIVQGMSGSPIIQNGKIIGAVTHVLVNDPQRGYGIFISNMIKDAFWEKVEKAA